MSSPGEVGVTPAELKEVYILGSNSSNNDLSIDQIIAHGDGKWPKQKAVLVLNKLVQERLSSAPRQRGTGEVFVKIRPQNCVPHLRKLTAEEHQVYCVVETRGSKGVWTRDISRDPSLSTLTAPKVQKSLKSLEDRRLIKQIKNINSKTRKTYMVSYLEPDKEVVGGAFYKEGEFNTALVTRLQEQILHVLRNGQASTAADLTSYLRSAGFSEDMSLDDLRLVLNTLILEQLIHATPSPATGEPVYTSCRWGMVDVEDSIASVPCYSCPVHNECTRSIVDYENLMRPRAVDTLVPEGLVSPLSCKYFNQWFGFGGAQEQVSTSTP